MLKKNTLFRVAGIVYASLSFTTAHTMQQQNPPTTPRTASLLTALSQLPRQTRTPIIRHKRNTSVTVSTPTRNENSVNAFALQGLEHTPRRKGEFGVNYQTMLSRFQRSRYGSLLNRREVAEKIKAEIFAQIIDLPANLNDETINAIVDAIGQKLIKDQNGATDNTQQPALVTTPTKPTSEEINTEETRQLSALTTPSKRYAVENEQPAHGTLASACHIIKVRVESLFPGLKNHPNLVKKIEEELIRLTPAQLHRICNESESHTTELVNYIADTVENKIRAEHSQNSTERQAAAAASASIGAAVPVPTTTLPFSPHKRSASRDDISIIERNPDTNKRADFKGVKEKLTAILRKKAPHLSEYTNLRQAIMASRIDQIKDLRDKVLYGSLNEDEKERIIEELGVKAIQLILPTMTFQASVPLTPAAQPASVSHSTQTVAPETKPLISTAQSSSANSSTASKPTTITPQRAQKILFDLIRAEFPQTADELCNRMLSVRDPLFGRDQELQRLIYDLLDTNENTLTEQKAVEISLEVVRNIGRVLASQASSSSSSSSQSSHIHQQKPVIPSLQLDIANIQQAQERTITIQLTNTTGPAPANNQQQPPVSTSQSQQNEAQPVINSNSSTSATNQNAAPAPANDQQLITTNQSLPQQTTAQSVNANASSSVQNQNTTGTISTMNHQAAQQSQTQTQPNPIAPAINIPQPLAPTQPVPPAPPIIPVPAAATGSNQILTKPQSSGLSTFVPVVLGLGLVAYLGMKYLKDQTAAAAA